MLTLTQLAGALERLVWENDPRHLPAWRALMIRYLRIGHAVIRELAAGQLTLRAMSLVYTTLLSLVPLLAVSFSVLKGLGVHNQFEPVLQNLLAPMGEQGAEVTARVLEFVENIRAGVLGTLGLGFLIYVVVSMIQKIEGAFNYTWHVSANRSLSQRFSNYLSVILVGPVLIVSALGLTASISHDATVTRLVDMLVLGPLIELLGRLLPYLMIIGAFTFIYVFVPNTRVRVRSALVGAIVAGALWESSGWAFTSFVVSSAKYTAIYSAFATLILFMIWLFLAWLILLVGATIAFYHQNPAYLLRTGREPQVGIGEHERLAVAALYLVAQRFHAGHTPWGDRELAERLHVPEDLVEQYLRPLRAHNMLVMTAAERPCYLPARPLADIALYEVLECIREGGEWSERGAAGAGLEAVETLFTGLDRAVAERLDGFSLETLLDAPEPPRPADGSSVRSVEGTEPSPRP